MWSGRCESLADFRAFERQASRTSLDGSVDAVRDGCLISGDVTTREMRDVSPLCQSLSIHKPPGYTHVVVATGPGQTIYLSGQIGITPDGKLAGADFHSQTIQLFENMKSALAEAGRVL
jgi:enamine deaminase RidA (YjgF/YER057c/UK114 family)